MITINTISEKYFSLNGINFAKIYQPLRQGGDFIGIYNVYDVRQQLVSSTLFSDFEIDGVVYGTVYEVVKELLKVTYDSRVSLLSVSIEGKTDKGGYSGTAFDLKEEIDSKSFEGLVTYQSKSDLDAVDPVPSEGTPAKVANDSNVANNGYYSVVSGVWVIDSFVANGVVSDGNLNPVRGGIVYSYLNNLDKSNVSKRVLSSRYDSEPFPCFVRNKALSSFDVDSVAHSGAFYYEFYSVFKSMLIVGSDALKRHKVSFVRKNHNTNTNAIQLMREESVGNWVVVFYMTVEDLVLNDSGSTFVNYENNGVRLIAFVDFYRLPDGFSKQLEVNKYIDEPAFLIKSNCFNYVATDVNSFFLKSNVSEGFGSGVDKVVNQKSMTDLVIVESNERNLFNSLKIRKGKAISSSSPFGIIDYTANNIVLTGFYKIPENCEAIDYGGVYSSANISARFSEEASDSGVAEIVVLDKEKGGNIRLSGVLKKYKYVVFSVFRGLENSEPNLSEVWVRFVSGRIKKANIISTRKPVVLFHMDGSGAPVDVNNSLDEYVSTLEDYGFYRSTFNILPSYFNDDYLKFYRSLQLKGNEISVHTDGNYNLSPSSPLTEIEFEGAVRYYLGEMRSAGIDVSGWVSSGGVLKSEFVPVLKKFVDWGQVLSNYSNVNYLSGINDLSKDNFSFRRIGIENLQGDSLVQEDSLLSNAKAAVDEAILQNAFIVFYSHSYNDLSRSYTLRSGVFVQLLSYIKQKYDEFSIEIGMNTNEALNYFFTKRLNE